MRPEQPPRAPVSRVSQGLAAAQLLAATVLVLTSAMVEDALSQWGWQLNLVVIAVLWLVLRRRTRGVADRSAAGLDERDLAARNHTSWWGYVVALLGGTATALVLVIAARVQVHDVQSFLDRAGTTLTALMLLAAVVPTAIMAATTPRGESLNETDDV